MSVLYGVGTLFALELLSPQMDLGLYETAVYSIQIFIWIFILLKDLLPAPTPLQEYFKLHLPLTPIQITTLHLSFDLCSVSSIALFLFSGILGFSPYVAFYQVISLFLIIILGNVAVRLLKTILAYPFQSNPANSIVLFVVLVTALLSGIPGYGISPYQPWVLLLLIIISIGRLSQLERQKSEVVLREKNLLVHWAAPLPPLSALFWRTFGRNKMVRNALIMSLVNKLTILAIYVLFSSFLLPNMGYTLFLLGFSPFFLIGSVFSNLTGYLPGLSRKLVLSGSSSGPVIRLFFTGSLLLLMADFFIAQFIALIIVDLSLPILLLFYLSSTLFLLFTGLLGTLFFARPVKRLDWSKLNFNTHPGILIAQALFLAILTALIEYIPSISFLGYLTLGLLLALLALLWWLPRASDRVKRRIITEL